MVMYTIKEIIEKRFSIKPCSETQYHKIIDAFNLHTGQGFKFLYNPNKYIRLYPSLSQFGNKIYGYSHFDYLISEHKGLRANKEISADRILDIIEINLPEPTKKKVKFEYIMPIFGMRVLYSEGLDQEEYDNFTEEMFHIPEKPIGCYTAYVNSSLGHFSLRFVDDFSFPVLAHEVFHLVNRVEEYLDLKCEETKALILEHTIREILERRELKENHYD